MDETRTAIFHSLLRADRPVRIFLYAAAAFSFIFSIYLMITSSLSVSSTVFSEIILLIFFVLIIGIRILHIRSMALYGQISLGCVSNLNRIWGLRKIVNIKPRNPAEQYDATDRIIEISGYAPRSIRKRLHVDTPIFVIRAKGVWRKSDLPYIVPDEQLIAKQGYNSI